MNSLNANKLEGKVVVLSYKYYSKGGCNRTSKSRAFLCESGFGCDSHTMGSAIYGKFIIDGEPTRVYGDQLERLATKEETKEWLKDAKKHKAIE